jgi:hypothetical protein
MERATPVQMRQCLIIADELKKAGIAFVAMPIIGDAKELNAELERRLDVIEKMSEEADEMQNM